MRIGARSWSSALGLLVSAGLFLSFLGGCGGDNDAAPALAADYSGGSAYNGAGATSSGGSSSKGGTTGKGGSTSYDPGDPGTTPGGTNVSLGGAQDFGYFRALLD